MPHLLQSSLLCLNTLFSCNFIMLDIIPENQTIDRQSIDESHWKINCQQVEQALRLSKNGSAPGMDCLPYELWKALNTRHEIAMRTRSPSFDIMGTATLIFQDIQSHGVHQDSDFTLSWMCPIYKKKDRADISNYRPITLLNTDYKWLTKVLSLKLIEEILTLVHPDQICFIPR